MKEKIMLMVASMMVDFLSAEDVRKWADMGLDLIEDKIAATPTTYDDKLAIPVIEALRAAFSIPDNDES